MIQSLGLDPIRFGRALSGVPRFVEDAIAYARHKRVGNFPLRITELNWCLEDRRNAAASIDPHYFFQDLWAARRIYERRPEIHVDVGSRIDGFVAHLLSFMPVTLVDLRPLPFQVDWLSFVQGQATDLAAFPNGTVESLSSLHALEHFGLGRYGDPIDPDAPFRALREFIRILAPEGRLYIGVPVGIERLEFNAHRVFAPQTIIEAAHPLKLVSFGGVDDSGQFHEEAEPHELMNERYACGLFEFQKAQGSIEL
jgi:SAM-dependent methyltransferase